MNWIRSKSRRVQAMMLLSVVLLGVLAHNLWGRANVQDLDESVSSIYDDRLLPATYVFRLTDHMYRKRLLWSEAEQPGRSGVVRMRLAEHDAAIGKLVKDFEATYLVAEESQAQRGFEASWTACRDLEQKWVARPSAELSVAMKGEFDRAVRQLGQLSEIQQLVGQDLKEGSKSTVASSRLVAELELALLVVVCALALMLAGSSTQLLAGSSRRLKPANHRSSDLH
jgi:hypothetical protein